MSVLMKKIDEIGIKFSKLLRLSGTFINNWFETLRQMYTRMVTKINHQLHLDSQGNIEIGEKNGWANQPLTSTFALAFWESEKFYGNTKNFWPTQN